MKQRNPPQRRNMQWRINQVTEIHKTLSTTKWDVLRIIGPATPDSTSFWLFAHHAGGLVVSYPTTWIAPLERCCARSTWNWDVDAQVRCHGCGKCRDVFQDVMFDLRGVEHVESYANFLALPALEAEFMAARIAQDLALFNSVLASMLPDA